jgi:hypothetical protein
MKPASVRHQKHPKNRITLYPSIRPSAPSRCLDGGDVDLPHRHHRLEGTLCLTAASRKRIG